MAVKSNCRCQGTVSQGKACIGQGCKSECFTLKPSSVASVKVNKRENDVRQGVEVPSPDIFRQDGCYCCRYGRMVNSKKIPGV